MTGNAQIKSTMLSYEDNGILTCFLMLEQKSSGQGFGEYRLEAPKGYSIYTDFWIKRILEVVGVSRWEDLKGKYVQVKGDSGCIEAIGHITDDKWFNPRQELDEMKGN